MFSVFLVYSCWSAHNTHTLMRRIFITKIVFHFLLCLFFMWCNSPYTSNSTREILNWACQCQDTHAVSQDVNLPLRRGGRRVNRCEQVRGPVSSSLLVPIVTGVLEWHLSIHGEQPSLGQLLPQRLPIQTITFLLSDCLCPWSLFIFGWVFVYLSLSFQ